MTVLLAVAAAAGAEAVFVSAAAFLSWRRPRLEAGISAEDQLARVVAVAAKHADGCPWETAGFPLYVAGGAR